MRSFRGLIILVLCAKCLAQKSFLDNSLSIRILRQLRDWGYYFGNTGLEEGRLFKNAKELDLLFEPVPDEVPFPCNVTGGRSSTVPTSVHRLRPGDIDIIAAIGDSLTAGAGLFGSNVLHVLIENRGAAFSGGGQGNWRKYLTLPNIFKEFNPKLFGYALADAPPHDYQNAQFNVGETGAVSEDTPFMAKELIRRMKGDPRVDIENHWKFITIFIGHNDFCSDICYLPSAWSALERHKQDMLKLLRTLRDNLPRTFVALVSNLQLENLVDARSDKLVCYFTRNLECPCLFGLKFRDCRSEYFDIITKWQEIDEEIATYDEFKREDFVVMLQPTLANTPTVKLPNGETDFSYFSSDCFHLSQKAHAIFANSIWNNLLEPIGEKRRTSLTQLYEDFLCPTAERPYLITWKNSDENKLPP